MPNSLAIALAWLFLDGSSNIDTFWRSTCVRHWILESVEHRASAENFQGENEPLSMRKWQVMMIFDEPFKTNVASAIIVCPRFTFQFVLIDNP